ncbi:MAG: exonuclease domain-containing protein [Gammaproteobacteria bacterium]
MWERLFGREFRRKRALAKAEAQVQSNPQAAVMRDFLAVPFPDKKTFCADASIVSLDLETTGLDPKKDEILSIGLVEIHGPAIKLSTAWHEIIRLDRELPAESVVIHQITDDQKDQGKPLEEVLPQLLERLRGKPMLVHFKRIEQNFLDAACRKLYGAPFVIPIIDTLELGQRVFERRNHTVQPNDLRLFNLRPRYNLPQYKAHNALNDALATAELFLAMAAEMGPSDRCKLYDFVTD